MGTRASEDTPSRRRRLAPLHLPRPRRTGGRSVLGALWARKTDRAIGPVPLTSREISETLWAAFGVNRRAGRGPFGGIGRTAGSASNAQEIDVYAALPEGIYRYDGAAHELLPVASGDHRHLAITPGQRGMLGAAPVHLVYVADVARYRAAPFQEPGLRDADIQRSYSSVAVGLIAANVELYAAATGLSSWFHNCDARALATALRLRPGQRALYAHTIGHPARPAARRRPRAGRRTGAPRSRREAAP
ncbi:MAG TPA: nitroreductase family protein [Anaeromyxobacteraceae bacterium]|nr:nitroreductase family protein [Anaeromyxobacteraceae bacterium]